MAEIVFEDFCKNLIKEVNFLVPGEKKEFVELSHCFDEENFMIFISFDKDNFSDEIHRFVAPIVEKTSEVFSKHWKVHRPIIESGANPPC